jgi:hypothetical protein
MSDHAATRYVMGTRVKAVLALAALVAACGDSEGTSASQNPDGPDPTGGAPAAGGSSTGGARPATGGGGSSTTGGRANTGGFVSTFGGFDGGNTGGTSATGGAIGSGGRPAATGGASEPTDCPELVGPEPDPDDGGVYDGDLVIESSAELDALGTYSVITGNLTIGGAGTPFEGEIPELAFSHLREVGGDLTIRYTHLTDLELPRLERVGGQLWVSLNLELLELRMPELTSVQDLYLDTDPELVRSEFPKLEEVSGTLYVHRNVKLVSWGLDALRSVASVTITANAALPQCLVDAFNENTGMMASSEATGAGSPPICDCPEECGRIVVDCN